MSAPLRPLLNDPPHAVRSYEEIARELGLTRGAVQATEARALRKLRKRPAAWKIFCEAVRS